MLAKPYHTAPLRVLIGVLLAGVCAAMGACQGGGNKSGSDPSVYYHVRSVASEGSERPWVILLPGSSGLTIFGDGDHYFRAAQALNDSGFDAVVVDYKPAYQSSKDAPGGTTGDKIAWVVGQAISWAKGAGKISANAPGAVVGWSLGGEGLWRVAADAGFLEQHNIRAIAGYYPTNQDEQTLLTTVPILVLTGERDDVVEVADVRAMVAKRDRTGGGEVTLKVFAGAQHGFDISSLAKKRTVELIPLLGPRATFQFDAEAAEESRRLLMEFLHRSLAR